MSDSITSYRLSAADWHGQPLNHGGAPTTSAQQSVRDGVWPHFLYGHFLTPEATFGGMTGLPGVRGKVLHLDIQLVLCVRRESDRHPIVPVVTRLSIRHWVERDRLHEIDVDVIPLA